MALSIDTARDRKRYLRGLLLAGAASMGLVLWIALGAAFDVLTSKVLVLCAIWVVLAAVLGYALIASGFSRRFKDPSLEKPMVLFAGACVLTIAHQLSPELRFAPMPWLLMAFAFVAASGRSRFLIELAAMLIGMILLEAGLYVASHGHPFLVLWQAIAFAITLGAIALMCGRTNDARVLATEGLRAHKIALNSLADAVISLSPEGRIIELNAAAIRLLGVEAAMARDMCLLDFLRPVSEMDRINLEELSRAQVTDIPGIRLKTRVFANATGESSRTAASEAMTDLECNAAIVTNRRGDLIRKVVVLRDVTDLADIVRQLEHDSTHDELTGIYNRRGFSIALESTVKALRKLPYYTRHALLILDLDQFKIINDTCGHEAGDQLLKQVALLLRECLSDNDIVARYGGDEFGLILQNTSREDAQRLAEKVLSKVEKVNFFWFERRFQTGASIGIAMFDVRNEDVSAIVRRADSSLYLAKELGRGRVQFHAEDEPQVAKKARELEWAARINDAIDRNLFELHAQLVASLNPAHEEHFEVLVRLRTDTGELLSPGTFIPAAERFGLMPALDRWVVSKALRLLREAVESGSGVPKVSINLSPQSVRDRDFPKFLKGELDQCKIPMQRICFELTETVAISDFDLAKTFIETFRALGCTFALDDVGAGFNSFNYLKQLTFDSIKIDGHYIRNLDRDSIDRALVESLVRAAESLGMTTVAEMVETEAIANQLKRMGVHHLQGYVVHRPEDFGEILSGRALPSNASVHALRSRQSTAFGAPLNPLHPGVEFELQG
jgi:diguanylate cyclase (GGDEF)-like protein